MGWKENFADYVSREGFKVFGDDRGFATYTKQVDGDYYLRDLYVAPDYRSQKNEGTSVVRFLADSVVEIAKKDGAKKLFGTVAPLDPNSDFNIHVLHAYQMRFIGLNDKGLLVFEKEI